MRPFTPAIVERAARVATRAAIVSHEGTFSYGDLLDVSGRIAGVLLERHPDLGEARICFHLPPGFAHVAVQWGIWRAGGIAVPLAISHPPPELEYVARDAEASVIISGGGGEETCRAIAAATGARFLPVHELLAAAPPTSLPTVDPSRRAMMVYTSGTTGRPKGVVTTHANIEAQIESLVTAWGWTTDDRILLVLPLHHVHGIVNVVACALWSGAILEAPPHFDAEATWDRIASGQLTLLMAVPTIYRKLIASFETADGGRRTAAREGCGNVRLMVSGSAALPVQMLQRWREITGHTLLERYGMTEMGMALSNPLVGERRPGFVGVPVPGVEVRLVDEVGAVVPEGAPGEVEVRGANVFSEYWRRPEATAEAFRDGWFRTGDTAVVERRSYRLLGRSSVDILKTGGYKVSALEIEELLREHPAIAECAVVGVEDPEWGERVSVAVEIRADATLTLDVLKAWARDRLAPYKVPRDLRVVAALPRNAMGKIVKPEVLKLFV